MTANPTSDEPILMPATSNDIPPDDSQAAGSPRCPTCGDVIPPSAPVGLCPKCALAGVAELGEGEPTITVGYARFEAPSIADVAAAFPQLEIVEMIGHGGMGAVYRARQPHLDRTVALKVLPKSLAATPEFTERFTREARMLGRLAHPNIVGIFDFGESGGFYYLLMEFVDGVNLRQAMKAGRFSPTQALAVVPEICEALQFAHDQGVLHRDIKPENILLDTKGRIKIADFGIAKLLVDTARGMTLTQGVAPGTPQYMAPEQFEQPGTVDHRADIYSLGVVLYEMLTGELPMGRFAAPSSKTGVGTEVDEVVFRALEKERDRRQQSANEMKTDITGMVKPLTDAPQPQAAAVVPPPSTADTRSRPMFALALLVAGAFIPLLLVIFGILASYSVRTQEQRGMAVTSKLSARMEHAESHARSALKALPATIAEDDPQAKKLTAELDAVTGQIEALREQRRTVRATPQDFWKMALLLGLAGIVVVLTCTVPPTVFAWKQLRRQRALGQTEGRLPVLIAAWLWPMVAMTYLIVGVPGSALETGPSWIFGLGVVLSVLGAIALAVWLIMRTQQWLSQPLNATQRRAFLDAEAPSHPLRARTLALSVLAGGIIALICLGMAFWLAPDANARASIILLGVIGSVCIAAYLWLVNRSYLPSTSVPVVPGYNPWPKRIFWLMVALFCLPIAMIGVSVLVPILAYQATPPFEGDYAVSVSKSTSSESAPTVQLQLLGKSSGIVSAKLILDGPKPNGRMQMNGNLVHMEPSSQVEWVLDNQNESTKTVTFVLPDAEAGNEATSQMNIISGRSPTSSTLFPDLRLLPLFEVTKGADRYRAWLELQFDPAP
jgi:serine/threonine protein kinase